MVTINNATRISYLVETAFAGGKAGVEYACTAVTDIADTGLTQFSFPAADLKLKAKKAKRTVIHGPTSGPYSRWVYTNGYETPEIVIEQFLQSDYWFTAANDLQSVAGADIDAGDKPRSYLIHVEMPVGNSYDYFDLCGCVLKKYELKGADSMDKPPTEVLTFICYDQVDSVACALDTDLEYSTDQPEVWNTIGINVDGDATPSLTDLTYMITHNYLNEDNLRNNATNVNPKLRYYLNSEIQIDMKALEDESGKVAGIYNLALDTFDIVVTKGDRKVTLTDMYLDDSNVGEIPGTAKEMEYSYTFKQEDTTIAEAAS